MKTDHHQLIEFLCRTNCVQQAEARLLKKPLLLNENEKFKFQMSVIDQIFEHDAIEVFRLTNTDVFSQRVMWTKAIKFNASSITSHLFATKPHTKEFKKDYPNIILGVIAYVRMKPSIRSHHSVLEKLIGMDTLRFSNVFFHRPQTLSEGVFFTSDSLKLEVAHHVFKKIKSSIYFHHWENEKHRHLNEYAHHCPNLKVFLEQALLKDELELALDLPTRIKSNTMKTQNPRRM